MLSRTLPDQFPDAYYGSLATVLQIHRPEEVSTLLLLHSHYHCYCYCYYYCYYCLSSFFFCTVFLLASCLIYARALLQYVLLVCGCVLLARCYLP